MTFDLGAYKSDLATWGKNRELRKEIADTIEELKRNPQSDVYARLNLQQLYAVQEPYTAQSLGEHRSKLIKIYNPLKKKPFVNYLHTLLMELGSQRFEDPAFWDGLASQRTLAVDEQRKTLAHYIEKDLQHKAISAKVLAEKLTEYGVPQGEHQQYATLLKQRGVSVFASDLAEDAENYRVPAGVGASWRTAQRQSGISSIFDILLLHLEGQRIEPITFYTSLAYNGHPITLSTVEKALHKAHRTADSNRVQASSKVLTTMNSEIKSDNDLRLLVYTLVKEQATQLLQLHRIKSKVKDDLATNGLDVQDIEILFSILEESAEATHLSDISIIRTLLEAGDLSAASQKIVSVDTGSVDEQELEQLKKHISDRLHEKQKLVENYHSYLRTGRYEDAHQAITLAIAMDRGDDTLLEKLKTIPPEPVGSVAATHQNKIASISWQASPSSNVTYRVIRTLNAPAKSAFEGEVIAEHTHDLFCQDSQPAYAEVIYYTVFAERNNQFSSGMSSKIEIYPAPHSFLIKTVTATGISASWETFPEASSVDIVVLEPSGREIFSTQTTANFFSYNQLTTGQKYTVRIQANYLTPRGLRTSSSTQVGVTPRQEAQAIRKVTSQTIGSEIQVTWPQTVAGYQEEIWVLPLHEDKFKPGEVVSHQTLTHRGGYPAKVLSHRLHEGLTITTVASFNGLARLYPLVVLEQGYLVGDSSPSGTIETPQNVSVEYFNDTFKLSWTWPKDIYQVQLNWDDEQQRPYEETISTATYQRNGGFNGQRDKIFNLAISSVAVVNGEQLLSAPANIELRPLKETTITYEQTLKGSRFFGKRTSAITARISNGQGLKVPVVLGLSLKPFLPLSIADCIELDRFTLDFTQASEASHTYEIPKSLIPKGTKQFWVVLFPENPESVSFIQPSTNQLKG